MKDTCNRGIVKRAEGIALILIMALMMFFCASGICLAEGDESGEDSGRQEITIEVVGEIPAEDISEQELPLAAGPNTEATDAARHAAMMGVVLLATIGYAVYFGRYDKRLADLRLEAAKAETAAMRRRKTDTAVNRRGDREEL